MMNDPGPQITSKLPDVGTTIFTVMSQMAHECGAINLSQGYPDYDGPQDLRERLAHYAGHGYNQYAPLAGVPALRAQIAAKVERFYDPAVRLSGGVPVHLPLAPPEYRIDWAAVARAITPRTRAVMINSPHNPTGSVLDEGDLEALRALAVRHDLCVIADEVYEHLVYDGRRHASVLRDPVLAARSFAVFSFGKTYHVTGWKTGYCVAPPALTRELRRVHQFVAFVANTPVQHALADYMAAAPEHLDGLPAFYQRKRERFNAALAASRFRFTPSAGTFFQLADYSAIADVPDVEFVRWLTREIGVAAIPLSVFYRDPPAGRHVRFCFCKEDATLDRAAALLAAL